MGHSGKVGEKHYGTTADWRIRWVRDRETDTCGGLDLNSTNGTVGRVAFDPKRPSRALSFMLRGHPIYFAMAG